MTTLVTVHPYDIFLLGKIPDASLVAVRQADNSAATRVDEVVTVAGAAIPCFDYSDAIGAFNDTEGGDTQTVTNLASRGSQNEETPVPTWEAPCTMRVYEGGPSITLSRDSRGKYVLFAEHPQMGTMVGVVVINSMTRPFIESGEFIVAFTLQNAGRYLPKWVA